MNSRIPPMPPMPPMPLMPYLPQMSMQGYSNSTNYSQMDYSTNYHQRSDSGYYSHVNDTDYYQRNKSTNYSYINDSSYYRPRNNSRIYSQMDDSSYYSQMNDSTNYSQMNDSVADGVQSTKIQKNDLIKKNQVSCIECKLDFTSQVVLDAHLQGARHAKQIRSKNILVTLQKSSSSFSKDQDVNGLKCNACNVFLNSVQQLETHLNGNRHKKKIANGNWTDKEIISRANIAEIPATSLPRPALKDNLLSCTTCKKFFNSKSQLEVHLASQKHYDKTKGIVSEKKKRFSPYYKKHQAHITSVNASRPLTNSFISGGYENCG